MRFYQYLGWHLLRWKYADNFVRLPSGSTGIVSNNQMTCTTRKQTLLKVAFPAAHVK